MIITCPSCSARYVVDPVKIGSDGRTVKCAKCGHAWAQPAPTPEELENAAGVSSAPAPAPTSDKIGEALRDRVGREAREPDADEFDEDTGDDFRSKFDDAFGREPEPPGRPLRSTSSSNLPALPRTASAWPARLAWIALIVVIGGVFGGGVMYQDTIAKTWPPSQKLYDLVGLTAEPIQKNLGVRSVKYTYPATDVLKIDGELVNLSKAPHDVPNLWVLFLDADGKIVKRWSFPPPERRMLPNEIVKFATEIRNPPSDAERIDVGLDVN